MVVWADYTDWHLISWVDIISAQGIADLLLNLPDQRKNIIIMEKSIRFYFQCLIQQSYGSKLSSAKGLRSSDLVGYPTRGGIWEGRKRLRLITQRGPVWGRIHTCPTEMPNFGTLPHRRFQHELLLARKRSNNQQRMTSNQKLSGPSALCPFSVPASISDNREARRHENCEPHCLPPTGPTGLTWTGRMHEGETGILNELHG